ncbi:hypothetical protein FACS18948_2740 [Clostridia bacterium]|nr:hypothetical protein FACS18948_2740 [Clostridia bacterium]
MVKAINAWAFPDTLTMRDKLLAAKRAGFSAFEPTLQESGEYSLDSSLDEFAALKSFAAEQEMELTSLATGLYWKYGYTDPEAVDKACEITRFQLKAAQALGVKTILVVPGNITEEASKEPYDALYDRALSAVKSLIPLAQKTGVAIGIENVWNKFLLTPLEMRNFIDAAGSPYVKCYLDVGNMLLFGYPEQWIATLGERVACVHVKDFKRSVGTMGGFCCLLEGDVNFPAVISALNEVNYTGPLIAEVSPINGGADMAADMASLALNKIIGD